MANGEMEKWKDIEGKIVYDWIVRGDSASWGVRVPVFLSVIGKKRRSIRYGPCVEHEGGAQYLNQYIGDCNYEHHQDCRPDHLGERGQGKKSEGEAFPGRERGLGWVLRPACVPPPCASHCRDCPTIFRKEPRARLPCVPRARISTHRPDGTSRHRRIVGYPTRPSTRSTHAPHKRLFNFNLI